MREVEFGHATDDDGRMSFRINLPIERARESPTAAAADDGQVERTVDLAARRGRFFWSTGGAWGAYRLDRAGDAWALTWDTREGAVDAATFRVGGEPVQPAFGPR